MTRTAYLKICIAAVILLAAGPYLVYSVIQSDGFIYSLTLEEFDAKPEFHARRVRLEGVVGEANFECNPGLLSANFDLNDSANRSLRIEYSGSVPDMFKVGHDVIVEGKLNSATGVFEADLLMTKCASKYEAEPAEDEACPTNMGQEGGG